MLTLVPTDKRRGDTRLSFYSNAKCTFVGGGGWVTLRFFPGARFHGWFSRNILASAALQCSELNCCGCLIAERFKALAVRAAFIDALQRGPVRMWNTPVSAAGLALLEMFKVFQRESIYCLGEKKALAVLDSELFSFFFFKKKRKTPVELSIRRDGEIFFFVICAKMIVLAVSFADMLATHKNKTAFVSQPFSMH